MGVNDNQCTPFIENLAELGKAIKSWWFWLSFRPQLKFVVFPPKGTGARIGHELKNTFWAEPIRKWKGRCPQEKDGHEDGV